MWNKPSAEELAAMPPLYSGEEVPLEKKVLRMHFFLGNCHWYGAEFSPEENLFFGYAILNGDWLNSEWGYFSLDELCGIKVKFLEVDRDLHFSPCVLNEIRKGAEHEDKIEC